MSKEKKEVSNPKDCAYHSKPKFYQCKKCDFYKPPLSCYDMINGELELIYEEKAECLAPEII